MLENILLVLIALLTGVFVSLYIYYLIVKNFAQAFDITTARLRIRRAFQSIAQEMHDRENNNYQNMHSFIIG